MTPQELLENIPLDKKLAMTNLRKAIKENLPNGFEETVDNGMISYVVPHTIFPEGYHCNPAQPLPFISIAAQKNFVAMYHMGIYASPEILEWFKKSYGEISKTKLDMGKSCIRFKKPEHIPLELIKELVSKISVQQWIDIYLQEIRNR